MIDLRMKICLAIVLLCIFLSESTVQAQEEIAVGVKKGDWIEYQVSTTGNPPEEFKVTWAKIEITLIDGTKIGANITTHKTNGSITHLMTTFDLEKGKIGAWFIIPANLKPGDHFYDELMRRNVTIQGEEQLTYAGAQRAITNATTTERAKRWDKITGVFVLCEDVLENFSIMAKATRTNMWNNQENVSWDLTSLYLMLMVASATIVGVALLVGFNKRKASNVSSSDFDQDSFRF